MQDKKQNLSLHYNPHPLESFRITKGIKYVFEVIKVSQG